jgi:hypothetical protein
MEPTKEISDYIRKGKKIKAVKLVRDSMGFSLKEAKEYVDGLEFAIKRGAPIHEQAHYSGISAIDGMEGHEFEYTCADLLKKVGFSEVRVTPGSGDQGVDVLASKDGIKYAIQCKNYASVLSNTPVQEVSAGKQFYGCHVGVVLTNSSFTPGAIQLAAANNVLLWERTKLEELVSMAGGLESLGICSDYVKYDIDDEIDDSETDISNRPRRGMRIWSNICIGWSILCFVMFAGGLNARSHEVISAGLGEGLFVLVLGIMFRVFSKSEKGNPNILIHNLKIKKHSFVLICIAIAFAFFIIAMGITGGFV